MDSRTQNNINNWLEGSYDDTTKNAIKILLKKDPKQVIDAFFTNLTFGTGGMRGLMGIGTNRMNIYTVRAATQGLANYIHSQTENEKQPLSVIIGYDSRHMSREFAEESAKVLAGNCIKAFIYKDIRPTPLVSFGCRFKKCISAIMITASHNPPEYNGYKVYWADGGQLVPPHDIGVIDQVIKIIDPEMVKSVDTLNHPLIIQVGTDIDEAYLKAIEGLQCCPKDNREHGKDLRIVYTSLHGTGITLVPKAFDLWGFTNYSLVNKQVIPDGDFPTAHNPNPEEKAALQLGIKQLTETKSDILIATDPDADRVGVVCLHNNEPVILSGNQVAAICLSHICKSLSLQKRLHERAAFIKTIGTTELFQAICDTYQRPCVNVLTGFKYIAEVIHSWDQDPNGYQYIFGGEESYGYLLGTYCRDKDAVVSSALIAEAALQAKKQGKTLVDELHDLFRKYGVYQESLLSLNFGETKEGKEQMADSMKRLRMAALDKINGVPVAAIEDYLISEKIEISTGKKTKITLPVSDVLLYWLQDGTKVMIRPSGTEPKVKLYCGVVEKGFTTVEEGIQASLRRSKEILEFLRKQLQE